jgi:lipopolysaccharide export system permease protein
MKILSRYLAREFILNFLLALAAFTTTYLIVEFFERVNAFMVNQAPLPLMAAYFLSKIPGIVYQISPPAVLLAAIKTLGQMSRHNEIIAMKAGGVALSQLARPILGTVLVICFVLLGISEFLMPQTNQNARALRDQIIHKKKSVVTFKQSQIWIHSFQAIYNIQLYDPEKNVLQGVTIFRFDPAFRLTERVDARSAHWEKGQWVFSDVSVTKFPPGGFPVRKMHPRLVLYLPEAPNDFRIAEKNPDEMNYRQLREYVQKVERDGYNARKYRTAMHASLSFPFVGMIMAMLGIPLALRKERGAGIAVALGLSILVSFIYYGVFSFSLALGNAETLPPFVSAWLGNLIFALVGIYLFLSVRH